MDFSPTKFKSKRPAGRHLGVDRPGSDDDRSNVPRGTFWAMKGEFKMEKWYSVELCPELAQLLKVWLRAKCVSYETSACGTSKYPLTHFEMYMDEEIAELCNNFLEEL